MIPNSGIFRSKAIRQLHARRVAPWSGGARLLGAEVSPPECVSAICPPSKAIFFRGMIRVHEWIATLICVLSHIAARIRRRCELRIRETLVTQARGVF